MVDINQMVAQNSSIAATNLTEQENEHQLLRLAGGVAMSAHTPGPWYVADDLTFVYAPNKPMESHDWCNRFDLRVNRGYDETNEKKTTVAECIANARLIAAAPELLEALRASIKYLAFAYSEGFAEAEKLGMEAEDAIAKATGSEA